MRYESKSMSIREMEEKHEARKLKNKEYIDDLMNRKGDKEPVFTIDPMHSLRSAAQSQAMQAKAALMQSQFNASVTGLSSSGLVGLGGLGTIGCALSGGLV